MENSKETVKVSIMQREFTVACSHEESQSLVEAAAYLDRQMRTIAKGSQVLGIDRCAIMAALNITHELLALKEQHGSNENLGNRLKNLHEQIDEAVSNIQQVGL